MTSYFIPLILISLLALLENNNTLLKFINNRYFYFTCLIFFILFIGFRNEIGCDWDGYLVTFSKIPNYEFLEIFNKARFYDIGHSILSKLISYRFDFSLLIFIYSVFFSVPLFIFAKQIKKTYLSLMISYPYYVVVVGMGPLRQSVAIAFIMLAIIYLSNRKNYLFYYSIILSILFHHSSLIISSFIITINNIKSNKKNSIKLRNIFRNIFIIIFFLYFFYNLPFLYEKAKIFIKFYDTPGLNKAKSAILIWIMNFIPVLIYIRNKIKFNFGRELNKIIIAFLVYEILILPLIFFNSVIAYRLSLYSFPVSIYITSNFLEVGIFKINNNLLFAIITFLSYLSLFAWLKYSYHSYCWLPYQNLLF